MKWCFKINGKECYGFFLNTVRDITKIKVKTEEIFWENNDLGWFFLEMYKSVAEIKWYRVYVDSKREVINFEQIKR